MRLWGSVTLGKQPGLMTLRFIAIQVTVVLLGCLSLGQATPGWAQEGATVRPDPLSPEIGVGNTGVVNILVEDVTDLYGFEFEITFDSTVLEVVDADPDKEGVQIGAGDFLNPDWFLDNTVDNENGTIAYAICQLSPSESVSGDGVLAIITWRGKALGTSPIRFAVMLLGAPGGVEISSSTRDGQIVVVSAEAAPTDTLTPPAAPTGTPTPLPATSAPTSTRIPATSRPTSRSTSTPIPPTSEPTSTPIPPTSEPPATALLEATEAPTLLPTSPPPSTARPTGVAAPTSTPVPPATPVPEATETPLPIATAVQPTSTAISTETAHPVSTQIEASPTPLPPTPVSPSGSSGISTVNLMSTALAACLLAATLGVWALWKRRQ